ncbi:MAG: GNAT family N-acetyltransferase, partial [Bulleidia sp.]|nr:GNAT family N-acetyltransferase [Bulleidia sp.]
MITKATKENTAEIKNLWKICFPQEDEGYIDYYFKNLFVPENCFIYVEDGKVVSAMIKAPHAIMFNDKVLRTSMILGVATLPEYRKRGYMKRLMEIVLDACEHTELITLIQAYDQNLYTPYGFRN